MSDSMGRRPNPSPGVSDRVVLIGEGIGHSRSPKLMNALFERFGLRMHYSLAELSGPQVGPFMESMRRGGYRGANVTSPHKQRARRAANRVDRMAAAIDAVNTLVVDDGRIVGYNTDVVGFTESIRGASIRDTPIGAAPLTVAILGTGGAARAAAYALLNGQFDIRSLTIYSRDADRGEACAFTLFDPRARGAALETFRPADLVVHATPVGLPSTPGTLLSAERLAGSGLLVDMVYSTPKTALMAEAEQAGMRTINGRAMFVHQALASFELFTGIQATPAMLPPDLF